MTRETRYPADIMILAVRFQQHHQPHKPQQNGQNCKEQQSEAQSWVGEYPSTLIKWVKANKMCACGPHNAVRKTSTFFPSTCGCSPEITALCHREGENTPRSIPFRPDSLTSVLRNRKIATRSAKQLVSGWLKPSGHPETSAGRNANQMVQGTSKRGPWPPDLRVLRRTEPSHQDAGGRPLEEVVKSA